MSLSGHDQVLSFCPPLIASKNTVNLLTPLNDNVIPRDNPEQIVPISNPGKPESCADPLQLNHDGATHQPKWELVPSVVSKHEHKNQTNGISKSNSRKTDTSSTKPMSHVDPVTLNSGTRQSKSKQGNVPSVLSQSELTNQTPVITKSNKQQVELLCSNGKPMSNDDQLQLNHGATGFKSACGNLPSVSRETEKMNKKHTRRHANPLEMNLTHNPDKPVSYADACKTEKMNENHARPHANLQEMNLTCNPDKPVTYADVLKLNIESDIESETSHKETSVQTRMASLMEHPPFIPWLPLVNGNTDSNDRDLQHGGHSLLYSDDEGYPRSPDHVASLSDSDSGPLTPELLRSSPDSYLWRPFEYPIPQPQLVELGMLPYSWSISGLYIPAVEDQQDFAGADYERQLAQFDHLLQIPNMEDPMAYFPDQQASWQPITYSHGEEREFFNTGSGNPSQMSAPVINSEYGQAAGPRVSQVQTVTTSTDVAYSYPGYRNSTVIVPQPRPQTEDLEAAVPRVSQVLKNAPSVDVVYSHPGVWNTALRGLQYQSTLNDLAVYKHLYR